VSTYLLWVCPAQPRSRLDRALDEVHADDLTPRGALELVYALKALADDPER